MSDKAKVRKISQSSGFVGSARVKTKNLDISSTFACLLPTSKLKEFYAILS